MMIKNSTKLYTAEQEEKRPMISWTDGIENSVRDRVVKKMNGEIELNGSKNVGYGRRTPLNHSTELKIKLMFNTFPLHFFKTPQQNFYKLLFKFFLILLSSPVQKIL